MIQILREFAEGRCSNNSKMSVFAYKDIRKDIKVDGNSQKVYNNLTDTNKKAGRP